MQKVSTLLFSVFLHILFELTSSNYLEDHPIERVDWRFSQKKGLLTLTEHNLDLALEKISHLLVVFHLGVTKGSRRLLPILSEIAKEMKKEIHPIPIGEISYDMKIDEYALRFQFRDSPAIRFFNQGKMSIYSGPFTKDKITEFMMNARWPETEPLHSTQEIERFSKKGAVNIIYYGDKMDHEDFTAFIELWPHFPKFRFGHSFEYDLNRPYRTKLPCLVVHSIFTLNETILCRDSKEKPLSHQDMVEFLKVFDHYEYAALTKKDSDNIFWYGVSYLILFTSGDETPLEKEYHHSLILAQEGLHIKASNRTYEEEKFFHDNNQPDHHDYIRIASLRTVEAK